MSWRAYLTDDRGHTEFEVGYTHNTNRMISAALVAAGEPAPDQCPGPLGKVIGPAWQECLDGASGTDGREYLDRILAGLRSDPDGFRAMNPANGWGDYDELVGVLQLMRDAVPDWPTEWRVRG